MLHIKFCWTLMIALLLLVCPTRVLAQAEAVGKIISIMGTAEYLPGTGPDPVSEAKPGEVRPVAFQSWKKVVPRQPVYATDEFRTAPRSRLRILFNDKSLLALGPGSQLKVSYYLHKPKDKLRQGQLNMIRGVSMYIINKSQIHKRSRFRMITPTAVVSSRGTQGYLKVSSIQTIVANDASSVFARNIDLAVGGITEVGENMRTNIAVGQQPSQPVAVPQAQLNAVRDFVVGWVFTRFSGLIEQEPGEEESDGEQTTEEGTEEEETTEETTTEEATTTDDTTTTEETTTTDTTDTTDTTTTTTDTGSGGSLLGDFTATGATGTGTYDPFTESYYLFEDTGADSCTAG